MLIVVSVQFTFKEGFGERTEIQWELLSISDTLNYMCGSKNRKISDAFLVRSGVSIQLDIIHTSTQHKN